MLALHGLLWRRVFWQCCHPAVHRPLAVHIVLAVHDPRGSTDVQDLDKEEGGGGKGLDVHANELHVKLKRKPLDRRKKLQSARWSSQCRSHVTACVRTLSGRDDGAKLSLYCHI